MTVYREQAPAPDDKKDPPKMKLREKLLIGLVPVLSVVFPVGGALLHEAPLHTGYKNGLLLFGGGGVLLLVATYCLYLLVIIFLPLSQNYKG